MSYSLYTFFWPLFSLLLGGLQITAAVLLLRERGSGPWLMLIGSVISTVGNVAIQIFPTLISDGPYATLRALYSFITFGSLSFAIGLLLHTLRRRALGNRIAELEAILAATHGERADRP